MKTLHFLVGRVLPLVVVAACSENPADPSVTGNLIIELVPGTVGTARAEVPVVSRRHLGRPGGFVAKSKTGDGGSAPLVRVQAGARAQPPLDGVEVRLSGPTNLTVDLPQVGNAFEGTIENLAPGNYAVLVIGSGAGEVTFFGAAAGVRVVAGQNTTANIAFNAFETLLDPFVTPTFAFAAPISFALVPNASFYQIEVARDANFTDVVSDTIPDNDGWAWFVSQTGPYFMRIRAGNPTVSSNAAVASNVEMFDVVRDTVGDVPANAFDLGSGTVAAGTQVNLNITLGDQDYFRVALQLGDQIGVGVFSVSLIPTSRLDPTITIENVAGTALAFNNDIDSTTVEAEVLPITVNASGDYFIRIAGLTALDVGHYEMDVTVNGVVASSTKRTVARQR